MKWCFVWICPTLGWMSNRPSGVMRSYLQTFLLSLKNGGNHKRNRFSFRSRKNSSFFATKCSGNKIVCVCRCLYGLYCVGVRMACTVEGSLFTLVAETCYGTFFFNIHKVNLWFIIQLCWTIDLSYSFWKGVHNLAWTTEQGQYATNHHSQCIVMQKHRQISSSFIYAISLMSSVLPVV